MLFHPHHPNSSEKEEYEEVGTCAGVAVGGGGETVVNDCSRVLHMHA